MFLTHHLIVLILDFRYKTFEEDTTIYAVFKCPNVDGTRQTNRYVV